MADAKPQNPEKSDPSPQALPTPQDYYAVLLNVINDVTHDPAKLRKLVYAMACQDLKPEAIVTKPIPAPTTQVENIFQLEQALQLERAFQRIEVETIALELRQPPRPRPEARATPTLPQPAAMESILIFQPASDAAPPRNAKDIPAVSFVPERVVLEPIVPAAKNLDAASTAAKPSIERDTEPAAAKPSIERDTGPAAAKPSIERDTGPAAAKPSTVRDAESTAVKPSTDPDTAPAAAKPSIASDAEIAAADASFEPPRAGGTVEVLTWPQHTPPERKEAVSLERIPSWLNHSVPVPFDYGPAYRALGWRSHAFSFLQLIAASAIGVVIGISGWVYLGGHQGTAPAPAFAPPQQVYAPQTLPPHAQAPQVVPLQAQAPQPQAPAAFTEVTLATGQPQSAAQPTAEPRPAPPFPLPSSYGVYAGVPGQLFQLEQLPIKVPDPRALVSDEITKPSTVLTPGKNLSFVVFRRDLVNSASQTATVRVVARVQRTTKFLDGKAATVPMAGVWRIRTKGYEFKVSPLEGRNEMVVIEPDPGFVFQPGRYALVLNGFGYDFTVAGQVTAPEQCLEQLEVANGAMLSECPKT